jgi:hypothetical protein
MGAGRDGALYINAMYKFARYYLAGFGPDGKPMAGKYLKGEVGTAISKDYPQSHDSAIIGPIPGAGGGVRVDGRGRIYLGIGVHPREYAPPAGFEKDNLYRCGTGTIIRFEPEGGEWVATAGKNARPKPAKSLEMNAGHCFAGADRYYAGLGPMSGPHCDTPSAARQGCCVCRVPRFDLDLYDRLYIPNNITNSVRIVDNNDNPICEFGAYGNFDSLYVPASSKNNKPLVTVPEIPLGWPVGVGTSERAVYVSDLLNRRVVRVDLLWKAEESCEVK